MSDINRIWKPIVELSNTSEESSSDRNWNKSTTCLRAQTDTQIAQLNREILRASQSYNSTAKSFGSHKQALASGATSPNQLSPVRGAMAPKLVHQQYNSPIDLYSMNNIKKTIEAHSEQIAPGVRGINFMKSNEPVNKQSEVYKLVREEEEEERCKNSSQRVREQSSLSPFSGAPAHQQVAHLCGEQATFGGKTNLTQSLSPVGHSTSHANLNAHSHQHTSRQEAKLVCCECGQSIVGPFAKLQDRFIHPHCFNCTTCGTSLKNSGYFTINDKLYCDIHARQVTNVMRLNYNFEPNKLSHQPAPNPVNLTVREPRDVSLQRSCSTSSLFNQANASGAINLDLREAKMTSKSPTSTSGSINHHEHQKCACATRGMAKGVATISTMFSDCAPKASQSCSCSCHAGQQREVIWTWRPQNQQQQQHHHHQTMVSTSNQCKVQQSDVQASSCSTGARLSTIQHYEHNQRAGSSSGRLPVCCRCQNSIRGPYVLAGQTTWCRPCSEANFVCSSCRRSLLQCGFIESGDNSHQYHCESCYENYLAPVCAKCTLRVKGDCLRALGKQWHPTCFVCGHCKQPFGNVSFYLEDNVPYCQRDWNLLFTTKCCSCSLPIGASDKWIEALNKSYHVDCFRCSVCQLKLEGSTFYCKGGKPFCKMHAR